MQQKNPHTPKFMIVLTIGPLTALSSWEQMQNINVTVTR